MYSLEEVGIMAYQMLMDIEGENIIMEIVLEELLNVIYDVMAGKEPTLDEGIMDIISLLLHYKEETQTHRDFYLIAKKCIEIIENK